MTSQLRQEFDKKMDIDNYNKVLESTTIKISVQIEFKTLKQLGMRGGEYNWKSNKLSHLEMCIKF